MLFFFNAIKQDKTKCNIYIYIDFDIDIDISKFSQLFFKQIIAISKYFDLILPSDADIIKPLILSTKKTNFNNFTKKATHNFCLAYTQCAIKIFHHFYYLIRFVVVPNTSKKKH